VHRRRRVRILDREIVTVRRLDVVDAQSVGARRTRAVEVERHAARLRRDLARFDRSEIRLGLEGVVDAQVVEALIIEFVKQLSTSGGIVGSHAAQQRMAVTASCK